MLLEEPCIGSQSFSWLGWWALRSRPPGPQHLSTLAVESPQARPGSASQRRAPVPGRRATREVELGGVSIAKDDQLILMLCGANRDADEFPEPTKFDVSRQPNRHMSFSVGPHRCLGQHLARIELAIAMEELHRRIPDYQLVPSDPPVFHSTQVRGCIRMPITFTPEKG